jgi:gamma-glutamyl-gamma-aminobutyrate hydrolase PuuD
MLPGGTLYRHIPDDMPAALEQRRDAAAAETWHDVELVADTLLYSLLGSASIRCNSSHHQAVTPFSGALPGHCAQQ